MTKISSIKFQIACVERDIEHLNVTLAALKLALAHAIREENEPMLIGIPEEDAAILRRAADFGLLIVPQPDMGWFS